MAKKQFLDSVGLTKLWAKIKAMFVAKETGKSLMTDEERTKLNGIQEGAERNVIKFISKEDGPLFVDITKGEVTIPTATDTDLGLIKESRVKELAKAQADAAASKVYKPCGSKNTIAEVLAIADAKVGDVYDVKQKFTLNDQKYPAGTNVVCLEATTAATGNDAKWDALGGTIDLDPYLTTEDANNAFALKTHGHKIDDVGNLTRMLQDLHTEIGGVARTVATDSVLGLVKSASATTGDVTVDGDGFMTVDSIPDSEIDRICVL